MSALNILVVCTGNACRSPLAEQLLRTNFAAAGVDVTVSSAGTDATAGLPMDTMSAELSQQLGGDPHLFRSTALTAELIATADLILTATRAHRSTVARLLPRAAPKTFTLTELARIVTGTADIAAAEVPALLDGSARSIAQQFTAMRGLTAPPLDAGENDIDDPFGRDRDVHTMVSTRIDAAVRSISAAFALSRPNDAGGSDHVST